MSLYELFNAGLIQTKHDLYELQDNSINSIESVAVYVNFIYGSLADWIYKHSVLQYTVVISAAFPQLHFNIYFGADYHLLMI